MQLLQLNTIHTTQIISTQLTQLNAKYATQCRDVDTNSSRGTLREQTGTQQNRTQHNSIQLNPSPLAQTQCNAMFQDIDTNRSRGARREQAGRVGPLKNNPGTKLTPNPLPTVPLKNNAGKKPTPLLATNYFELISRVQRSPICFWTQAGTICLFKFEFRFINLNFN